MPNILPNDYGSYTIYYTAWADYINGSAFLNFELRVLVM